MKKLILTILLAILIGISFGKLLFDQYKKKVETVLSEDETIYVFQQGVYSSMDNVKSNTTKLDYYITVIDKQYYRVYVAVTRLKDCIDKVKEVYVKKGNDIYVRELKTNKRSFIDLVDQYDKLLKDTTKDEEIIQIEKQAISGYEELIIRNE